MPDHLDELRRQHALIRQHLDWLEREIARLEARLPARRDPGVVASPEPPASPYPALPAPTRSLAVQEARNILAHQAAAVPALRAPAGEADAILAEYGVPPDRLRTDLRRGCLLYAIAALALAAAVFGGWYLLRQ